MYKCHCPLLVLSFLKFFVYVCVWIIECKFFCICVLGEVLKKKREPVHFKIVGVGLLRRQVRMFQAVTCETPPARILLSCIHTMWLLHHITKERWFLWSLKQDSLAVRLETFQFATFAHSFEIHCFKIVLHFGQTQWLWLEVT